MMLCHQALCIQADSTHNHPMDTHGQPDLQSLLRRTLAEYGGVRQAILFGSRATGHAKTHSDLDLAEQMSTPLSAANKIALIEK